MGCVRTNVAYADSAYRSKKIGTYLESINCKSHIHEKGYRNRSLSLEQEERNRLKSKIHSKVEHVFGFMTNLMHNGLNLKAIGKKRIDSLTGLLNLTYNLFRYEQIVRLQKVKIMQKCAQRGKLAEISHAKAEISSNFPRSN